MKETKQRVIIQRISMNKKPYKIKHIFIGDRVYKMVNGFSICVNNITAKKRNRREIIWKN